jgi:hypothetical protein
MYLRQIAMPALGVDVTYSLTEHRVVTAISAGLTL